jgi:GGDEF domain-containing protein
MNYISFPVILMCAIAFYVALYHLYFYFIRKESLLNFYFSALCFSVGLYDIACIGLYNSLSLTSGIFWQKCQYFSIILIAVSFFYFTYFLINRKRDLTFRTYVAIMIVLFGMGILFNDHIFSSNDPITRQVHFFSFIVTYYEVKPILLMNILYILLSISMIYLFSLLIRSLVKQNRRDIWPLIIGISVFFISCVMDILVGAELVRFIYTAEYAFLMIIFTMDYALLRRFVSLFFEVENMNVLLEEKVIERTSEIRKMADEVSSINKRLENTNSMLAELAERDSLTKLYNHAAFQRRLAEVLNLAQRHSFEFSVAMMDIDFFKNINDTYGHIVGDQVIRKVGEALNPGTSYSDVKKTQNDNNKTAGLRLRNYDIVGRYGGDEFALLISFCGEKQIGIIIDKICHTLKEIIIEDFPDIHITMSIGAVVIMNPLSCTDRKKIIKQADHALYTAKERGRNQAVITTYADG